MFVLGLCLTSALAAGSVWRTVEPMSTDESVSMELDVPGMSVDGLSVGATWSTDEVSMLANDSTFDGVVQGLSRLQLDGMSLDDSDGEHISSE